MRAALLASVIVLTVPGCIEDIVRDLIDVPESDVFLTPNPDMGDSDATIPSFLSLLNVKPDRGPFVGGTKVVITGSGFSKGTVVRIGGKQVSPTEITLISPVSMEVLTPAGEVGPADVDVDDGSSSATLPKAYTYEPVHLDPTSGPTAGGTLVTLQTRGLELAEGLKLTLGGLPMTDIEVISSSALRARTPASPPGPADLVLGSANKGEITIREAFSFYDSTDPLSGGLGGGPIAGTVTVAVLNWLTRAPVPGARVVLQKDRELELIAISDSKGLAVFQHDALAGRVTVTAGAPQHETSTIVAFDARDVTIFLYPIIPPQPGSLPPGQLVPVIYGNVLFGAATGAGAAEWRIVPAPKEDQVKRVYVLVTNPTIHKHGPPTASGSATIDFEPGTGATAWPFDLYSRMGNIAVYALAGLYHKKDNTFVPYAMGVTRGVVTAPGDQLKVDVVIDMPLTQKISLRLVDPPPQVDRHQIRLAIHLGADGYLLRQDQEVVGEGVPATFAFPRLPKLSHPALIDATYAVDVMLDSSGPTGLPLARATETLVKPQKGEIVVDGFVGVPMQVKPAAGGVLQGNTLRWTNGGAPSDLALTVIEATDETPVWRVISPGDVTEVQLPDPATFGLPAWPTGPLVWLQWLAKLESYDYDSYNYSHLSSSYWRRWSFDQFFFEVSSP